MDPPSDFQYLNTYRRLTGLLSLQVDPSDDFSLCSISFGANLKRPPLAYDQDSSTEVLIED